MQYTSVYDSTSKVIHYKGTTFNLGIKMDAVPSEIFAAHHIIDFYLGEITLDQCIRKIKNEFRVNPERVLSV